MSLKNVARLVQPARQLSQTAVKNAGEIPEGYHKLKNIQAAFQKPDGLPVHLKGGAIDKGLYGLTILLCAGGLGSIGKLFYDLGWPHKEE